jgi:hypothetical protein
MTQATKEPDVEFDEETKVSPRTANRLRGHSSLSTIPENYQSPNFEDIEKDFKDTLLNCTTDLLLNDFDLLKNITERGNKIIFHQDQIKQLIAIQYLGKEDRQNYDKLIQIETEKIIMDTCLCKTCVNPAYEKIKHIFVDNKINFLTTPVAVNMSTTFKISLEFCLTEKLIKQ